MLDSIPWLWYTIITENKRVREVTTMKTYTYITAGQVVGTDNQAFGSVWKRTKALAINAHTGIWRVVKEEGKPDRKEYYCNAGCFLKVSTGEAMKPKIF